MAKFGAQFVKFSILAVAIADLESFEDKQSLRFPSGDRAPWGDLFQNDVQGGVVYPPACANCADAIGDQAIGFHCTKLYNNCGEQASCNVCQNTCRMVNSEVIITCPNCQPEGITTERWYDCYCQNDLSKTDPCKGFTRDGFCHGHGTPVPYGDCECRCSCDKDWHVVGDSHCSQHCKKSGECRGPGDCCSLSCNLLGPTGDKGFYCGPSEFLNETLI